MTASPAPEASKKRAEARLVQPGTGGQRRFSSVVARLSVVNAVVMASGLLTGPLLAHALGPAGRGDLAAILVPLALAPGVLSLGFQMYAGKAAAQGRSVSDLALCVGGMSAIVGLIAAAAAPFVAAVLAEGRHTVYVYLLVGFVLLPYFLISEVLRAIANGLERWGLVIANRLTPPILTLFGIVAFYVMGALTVEAAAALTIVAVVFSGVPLIAVLRRSGSPRIDSMLISEAIAFGPKAWVGTLAGIANYRLDQLLMIPLVPARELGLYAVAATLASSTTVLSGALGTAVFPRVAKGAIELPARVTRMTLALVSAGVIALGLVTPWLLPLLFGDAFRDAVPMAWILLLAAIPGAAIPVLAYALWSADAPGAPTRGELLALLITVPGLILVLPSMGGIGAAFISLAAYTTTLSYLIIVAKQKFGSPTSEYLFINRSDAVWAVALFRPKIARIRALRPSHFLPTRCSDDRSKD